MSIFKSKSLGCKYLIKLKQTGLLSLKYFHHVQAKLLLVTFLKNLLMLLGYRNNFAAKDFVVNTEKRCLHVLSCLWHIDWGLDYTSSLKTAFLTLLSYDIGQNIGSHWTTNCKYFPALAIFLVIVLDGLCDVVKRSCTKELRGQKLCPCKASIVDDNRVKAIHRCFPNNVSYVSILRSTCEARNHE